MKIITSGRTDLDDLFRISGMLTYKKLNHTPYLAFVGGDIIEPSVAEEIRRTKENIEFQEKRDVIKNYEDGLNEIKKLDKIDGRRFGLFASKLGHKPTKDDLIKRYSEMHDLNDEEAFRKLMIDNLKKHLVSITPKGSSDSVRVLIIDNTEELLQLPEETPVMVQWSGQYHSDFFQFTVKDIKDYMAKE